MKLNEDPDSQNKSPRHAAPLGALPEMETEEEAIAVSKRENDPFYACAFVMKCWLARLVVDTLVRLVEQKQNGIGSPQTGQAWRGFRAIFGHLDDEQFHIATGSLNRFMKYSGPLSELLLRANAALQIEHAMTGDYVGRRTLHIARAKGPPAVLLMRRTAERLCEWLDATIHLETYGHCQLLGSQPDLLYGSQFTAYGYPMCKRPGPDESISAKTSESELWTQREIDTVLIALHPVAKRNHWTSGDLLKVVRKLVPQPQAYPCWSESDLASYRQKVLALPALPPGPAPEDKDLFPVSFDVAIGLCPPLCGDPLAQPLWS